MTPDKGERRDGCKQFQEQYPELKKDFEAVRLQVSLLDKQIFKLTTVVEESHNNMKSMIDHHEKFIHGSNGDKGAKTRLNSLEEERENRKLHTTTLYATALGFFGKLIYEFFKVK